MDDVSASGSPVALTEQIVFARLNFDNLQSLIRFADTKVGAIVTLVIFLGGTAIPVAKDAVHKLSASSYWRFAVSAGFVASALGFLITFLLVLWAAQEVIKPRGTRHYPNPLPGKDLLWQDHVLAHGSQGEYFVALAAAGGPLLLRNITDQVFELASISREKMNGVQNARTFMWWVFGCWSINVLTGFLLLR